MKGKWLRLLLTLLLLASALTAQFALRRHRTQSAPALAEGAYAALGGLRSLIAEFIWFRVDRLQSEGRFVELSQLTSLLTAMEPHTAELWSYAAWNLAYNVSVMLPERERWNWVYAGIRLLRDEGLMWNPNDPEICEDVADIFMRKLSIDDVRFADSASKLYRDRWREIVNDVAARGAWDELKMNRDKMAKIERETGFKDWTDPALSVIYWVKEGLDNPKCEKNKSRLHLFYHLALDQYHRRHR